MSPWKSKQSLKKLSFQYGHLYIDYTWEVLGTGETSIFALLFLVGVFRVYGILICYLGDSWRLPGWIFRPLFFLCREAVGKLY